MSFKQNMLRGLGKCHVDILNSKNRNEYKEDILYAALNPISYDIYFESTKCWYIYDLILGMQDNDFFELKIIEKLESTKHISVKLFNHLTDLLDQFAYDGSETAKNTLEKQYQIFLNKRKFSEDDYEKLCNLMRIFDDLYGKKRLNKIIDDIYEYKLKHKLFDVTNLWFIQSLIFNCNKIYTSKLKTYFPEFDYEYNKKNIPLKSRTTIDDIRNASTKDLSFAIRGLDKKYHPELINYLLEINDKERSIKIVKNLKVCNRLFNEKIDSLLSLIGKYDLQFKSYFIDFLVRHKNKKLRHIAYELINDSLYKELGIELLIINHNKDDNDFLYNYFRVAKFKFQDHVSHSYVSNLIKYFKVGGKDEKIKSLLIYYYENNYCSYCRKEIIDILIKFEMLTDEIIQEMQYDCNYDIRQIAKEIISED